MEHVDWSAVRQKFPVCNRLVYLNAAGGSPMCVDAAIEARRYYDEMLQYGDTCWDDWLDRTREYRSDLAGFIGASADEVAFIPNTSTGMALMALMLRGTGEVITMEDEFPSTTLAWKNQGYEMEFVPAGENGYDVSGLARKLRSDHRILITSYVQYRTGFRHDLEKTGAFCRTAGLLFGVNATQAMGVFPVDVKKAGIDFLVFSGLKWACAGYGCSGLYVSRRLMERYPLPVVGWRSVPAPENMDNNAGDFNTGAAALEAGSPDFPSVFALGGALRMFNSLGREQCMNRVLYLNRLLEQTLVDKGLPVVQVPSEPSRSGILILPTPHAHDLVAELLKRGIVVSARGAGLRISVNIFNNEQDIDTLATELVALKHLL
jgi:cysteine desulfurase / selenocysteine lyase